MSAGTGVRHSEFNQSKADRVHMLQIWILPEKDGIAPSYEQKFFADDEKRGRLRLIAAPGPQDGAVQIHQDAKVYATLLGDGETVQHAFDAGRSGWIHVARGSVSVNGQELNRGDGAAVSAESSISITGSSSGQAEVLLFDMA